MASEKLTDEQLESQKVERIEQVPPKSARHVGKAYRKVDLVYCVVPHLSRVMPERVNGPLFGGVA